jgi:hypothetical protein
VGDKQLSLGSAQKPEGETMWYCKTQAGIFEIHLTQDRPDRSMLSIGERELGTYPHPIDAAHAVSEGTTGYLAWDDANTPHKPGSLRDWESTDSP